MDIEGRVALVTGAGQRVGRAIAVGLAAAGADVAIHFHRSGDEALAVVAQVEALGRRAVAVGGDLADPTVPARLLDATVAGLGPATILVNSASGFPADTLTDVTPEGFAATLAVTLTAPVFLTQAFAAGLPDGTGAVVNVGDVRTATPYLKRFSYIVAKGGLDTFTRAAALALAPRVRVNAVALGVILPPADIEDDGYALRLAEQLPLQRPGGTAPVVDAVLALLQNDFITGETLRVDGGGHLL